MLGKAYLFYILGATEKVQSSQNIDIYYGNHARYFSDTDAY
jgi:hypothetical protein